MSAISPRQWRPWRRRLHQVGYSSGDISVSTGDNDLGEATSLVVSVNLVDDPAAGDGFDYHRAAIGHGAWQVSDASASMANYRAGREGLEGSTDIHSAAYGRNGGFYATNGSGGRGGNAQVVQGMERDNDPIATRPMSRPITWLETSGSTRPTISTEPSRETPSAST